MNTDQVTPLPYFAIAAPCFVILSAWICRPPRPWIHVVFLALGHSLFVALVISAHFHILIPPALALAMFYAAVTCVFAGLAAALRFLTTWPKAP